MSEETFREALRAVTAASPPPPPMSSSVALAHARRARLRRWGGWLAAGSALTVAIAAVGTAVITGAIGPGSAQGLVPGALPSSIATGPGGDTDTQEPWPTGPDGQPQQDRTATGGPRFDQGVALLDATLAAVPDGFTVPTGSSPGGIPHRWHQAQFDERVGGVEVWTYSVSIALARDGGLGQLTTEVVTAANRLPTQPCALAPTFWGMGGPCQTLTVNGVQVGVVTKTGDRYEQWAGYRHPDGVVVYAAQSLTTQEESSPLAALPFTAEQLATLAASAPLHLR